jgi:hypothetical protein
MKSLTMAVVFGCLFAAWPVVAQTPAQRARESSGEANSQKQLGGLKKDREISRKIIHHEQRHYRHHHHAQM